MYKPNPIDTEQIKLPESLLQLTEQIAENVHENWAEGRVKEGWTYGERRDDKLKTTPCLVPYSELTDSEKQYDRNTAIQTLKLIVALGYEIKKKESEDDEHIDVFDLSTAGVNIPNKISSESLVVRAAELAIANGHLSTSLLQRHLLIGYGRSVKILDMLVEAGYILPPVNNRHYKTAVTEEKLLADIAANIIPTEDI